MITRTFWVSFTIFYFCKTAFAAAVFLRTLFVFGFWLYSFRSPAMWEGANGEQVA